VVKNCIAFTILIRNWGPQMRYMNTLLGLVLHCVLILLAYTPLFIRCFNVGLHNTYPIIILFWLMSFNEMLLAVTPPSVIVLPVCSFMFSIVFGLFMTQLFPWIYPFLLLAFFIFVLSLFLQFLITLIWFVN